jgi:hypothetical protein
MVATTHRPTTDPRVADLISAGDRAAAILLYVRRLGRLLALETTNRADLTGREQLQLRGRAMLASVRALTELGAGAVASEILRESGRRRRRADQRRARELPVE